MREHLHRDDNDDGDVQRIERLVKRAGGFARTRNNTLDYLQFRVRLRFVLVGSRCAGRETHPRAVFCDLIKQWKTESCPPRNRKGMYSLVAVSDAGIVAMHTTAIMRFVDDITFNFSSPNSDSCEIKANGVCMVFKSLLND
ncbi:hypothetical protein P4O66_014959, partial [Electrophorus voltai]